MRAPGASSISSSDRARGALLALAVPAAAVVLLACGAAWLWRGELRALGSYQIALDTEALPALARWQGRPPPRPTVDAVLLGDSIVSCGNSTVAAMLERTLRARGTTAAVAAVWHNAFHPRHFYYLLDDLLAGRPATAIVAVDLRAFAPTFLDPPSDAAHFRSLSRRLSFRRALAATDMLAEDDVTLLDPAIYRVEERLDLLWVPEGARGLGRRTLDRLGSAVQNAAGLGTVPLMNKAMAFLWRVDAARARGEYGIDQTRQSSARLLRLLTGELRAANARVLLYVSPVNVERMEEVGVREELALPARMERLRVAIGAVPGEWLDLHALAPARHFRDGRNHLTPEGCTLVVRALADALAGPGARR